MKGVKWYELFGGIALKNQTFFIFISVRMHRNVCIFSAKQHSTVLKEFIPQQKHVFKPNKVLRRHDGHLNLYLKFMET